MDPRLESYIQEVRGICAGGFSQATIVRKIQEASTRLVAEPVEIGPEHRNLPDDGYGRNLLHRDDEHGFVVIAMCWPPGVRGLPHDHGTWGVVAIAEGDVEVVNFERQDDGSDPSRVDLLPKDRVVGGPGAVGYVLPPHIDFHTIGNQSDDEPALTIHTYGTDIRECRVVDPATGKVETARPSYH